MFVCNVCHEVSLFPNLMATTRDWVASSGWQSRWRAVIRLLVVGPRGPASSLSPEVACPWQKRLDISINANSLFNFMFSLILPRLRAPRSDTFILKILGHQWAKRWKYEGVSIASSSSVILVPKKTMTKKIRRRKSKKSKKIFIVERGYSKRNGKLSEETREQIRRE